MRYLALFALLCAQLTAAEFRLGRAAVQVTPPVGIPMAGYYNIRLAEGTHDELWAKALVFEQEGSRAAIVVCDLIGFESPLVRAARQAIEKATGIAGERVMISTTHSHTGPVLRGRALTNVEGRTRQISEDYLKLLPVKIAEAVRLANENLAPARISVGAGREDSLSFNRRFFMTDGTVGWNPGQLNPKIVKTAGPIDPAVPVVYFESPEGKPQATFVNFAMHLDTVGGLEFSADYPYTLAKILGRAKGDGMLTVFSTGTCGNLNHIDVSTSAPQKGHQEAERIGTVLAGEVIKTYARLQPATGGSPEVRRQVLMLKPPSYDSSDVEKTKDVAARYGKPNAAPFLEQVRAFQVLDLVERAGKPVEAEVQVIALGSDIAWVGLPGEIFVELGTAIKMNSPFRYTIVSELANGNVGYVPNRKAYPEGNYEVVSARVAAGSGEEMVDTALRLLGSIKKQ